MTRNQKFAHGSILRTGGIASLALVVFLMGCAAARVQSDAAFKVRLQGELIRKTYPGPPNFESVADGDEAENYWYVVLDGPFSGQGPDAATEPAYGERSHELQLVLSQEQYREYAGLVGTRVVVVGSCFHGFSGHHHTDWLVIAKEVCRSDSTLKARQ